MRFYIAFSIGCIIGFLICAIFASGKIARLERFITELMKGRED